MSEVVPLLPNTDRLQQVEDYVRSCTTSTKYWPPSTSWRLCQKLYHFYQILTAFNKLKIMSEVVPSTSTKYWPPSTSWRLCQKLYHFYQILTAFNKLKIMSEVVSLLPNTDRFQQVEDYVMSEVVSLLPNTDRFQQVEDYVTAFKLYHFYQILTAFNKLKIMSEVVPLLPNTDRFQQIEDYVRSCTTSTKYWPLSTSWRLCQKLYHFYQILTAFNKLKIMSEVVLLLTNTDRLQQVEDYVRSCTTSTKYWPLSTSWRLCQKLYYFYQILTAFNKLKIMSEVVPLLPNTDRFQQVEDYVRSCTTSTKYWPLSTSWQKLYLLTAFNKLKYWPPLQQVEDYVRSCTTSTKYWPLSTSWRLCQKLYHFYQILTAFNKLKIMSEVVLLLTNTDRLQQVEDYVRSCTTSTKYWPLSTSWRLCQKLYYFYQILTAFNKLKIMSEVVPPLPNTDRFQQVEDYVRSCTTKYWPPSQILTAFNKLKVMSEVVPLLPNTDRLQQVEDYVRGCTTSNKYWPPSTSWRLCQKLYHFYQILTAFNKLKIMSEVVPLLPNTDRFQQVEDYVRSCTTSTKYWPPSTSWRLCQKLYHFYQILTAFNKLKIMSEVEHDKIYLTIIQYYLYCRILIILVEHRSPC